MAEITALPGGSVPGTNFRRDQPVIYRGDEMLFLGIVNVSDRLLPMAILWHGGGRCFARLEEIEIIYHPWQPLA